MNKSEIKGKIKELREQKRPYIEAIKDAMAKRKEVVKQIKELKEQLKTAQEE